MSDDGGPAYPYAAWEYTGSGGETALAHHAGAVTLRDYFAAKALQAMLTNDALRLITQQGSRGPSEELARGAYAMAEAMLAERAK